MLGPYILSMSSNTTVVETKVKTLIKEELLRMERILVEFEFSVELASNYFKLARFIEGEKQAGVRVMRAMSIK